MSSGPSPKRVREFKKDVLEWAAKLGVRPRQIRVQRMTRKWGSCSRGSTLTFASELLTLPGEFRRFVIVHELLHLRVRNHSRLFKSYMSAHVPNWRLLAQHHTRASAQ